MRLGFDLVLLGDPASGKDTQALLLSKKYAIKLARSGEYLRKHKPKQYVHGGPAPSALILPFLNHAIKTAGSRDLVFVGAARLVGEAKHLVKALKENRRDFFVLYLKLPKSEIIRRSNARDQRLEDKKIELIKNRIKYFKQLVTKTTKFYKEMKKIKYINADQSINQVAKDIQKAINDYQRSK